ncbi:MAG: endopeptidase La [Bacteroidales bacterium]|nr:endopeptidase La [Candidatus Physcousia equi]
MTNDDNGINVNFIADFEGDVQELTEIDAPECLPLLPLRNMTLFPSVMTPISITRKSSLKALRMTEKTNGLIAVFCQRNPDTEAPLMQDLFDVGVMARIARVIDIPGQNPTVILQALCRLRLQRIVSMRPAMQVGVTKLADTFPTSEKEELQFRMLMEDCHKRAKQLFGAAEQMTDEAKYAINNIQNDHFFVNFLCTIYPFSIAHKMEMLRQGNVLERTIQLMKLMSFELQISDLRTKLKNKTQADLDDQQREYFLHQQLRNIQRELGNVTDAEKDGSTLREQAKEKVWPKEIEEAFAKELSKLERINPQSPDYNVQLSYLQTILQLPWLTYTSDHLNIPAAEKTLNRDHYGMEKVKERILEHLAVLKLRNDLKSPIICLYGPPGVGKTSLGKSIAESLKRKYVRMSLGGLHDEAEIRGHRRTYIGAMPGRVIKSIIKAGSSNPVFILDEIDKVTQTAVHGDPASALLEVLDPEQNSAFHDNYLDLDYDLSKVMFIATANNINTIPQPLLDRMELIEVSGYITEEKIEIARKHLVPKQKEENGLAAHKDVKITKAALERIIEDYTRESGVRSLEKQIGKIFRKIALKLAREEATSVTSITPAHLVDLLGKPPYNRDRYQGNGSAGVVTGLAWTSVGGEILFIETSLSRGKGGKLTLTGNLGDVMKESAVLALEYIKAHADALKIDMRIFDNYNIHIHVPEGAVPKDGPSAGVTMATSLASALTQRKVRQRVAMTGEITLRGKVLPVGGIKEKILAAKRAGITDILICQENSKDIEEIPQMYLDGVTFHYVDTVQDVLNFALLKQKVDNAIQFTYDEEKKES